jgi:phytoene dehydrogenase-like protein
MFGAVFARCAAERGKRVLIVDKRDHIAGNCYTEAVAGFRCIARWISYLPYRRRTSLESPGLKNRSTEIL